jgi:outer membrane receptor for ferrienterochelin and colicin
MRQTLFTILLIFPLALLANNISGVIIDNETNEPIPFANIIIDGTNIGTASDLDGKFIFTDVKSGYVRLLVSSIGYETTYSRDILVTKNRNEYIEIRVNSTSKSIDEITIKTSPFVKNTESPVSLQKIGIEEIETNPGSNRDISKVIQSFPGVGGTPAFRNDIIIRGGGPSENAFYLDGVEIPNINHFATQGASGGPVGILNADLISGVDFYSGAFPANTSDALSGVFVFKQKDGNSEKAKFRASLGASETSLTVDGPLSENTNYILSVRRSYLQFLFSALQLPFLPTFTDYQVKVKHKLSKKSELTFVSIGALDQFDLNTGLKDPDSTQQYILDILPVNEQWSYAAGLVHKQYFDKGNLTTVISRNALNNVSYKYLDNDESKGKTQDYESNEIENKLRLEYKTKSKNGFRMQFGGNYEYAYYDVFSRQRILVGNQVIEEDYTSDLSLHKFGVFSQFSQKLAQDRLALSVGLRADGNSYSSYMSNLGNQFSWRASASYAISEKLSINANTGKYFQLPAYTTLGYRANGKDLSNTDAKYINVQQYIAGLSLTPNKSSFISLEGFYKQYGNYPFSVGDSISLASQGADYGIFGATEISSTGEGRAYGAELSYRLRSQNGLTASLAYTYVISEAKDKTGAYIPTTWDSEHLLTATAVQKLKKNWSIGSKFRLVGGLPYTPYDLESSKRPEIWSVLNSPVKDLDRYNAERFDAFHQLDVRVDKQYYFDKWSLMVYLDIQNLYNFQSPSQDLVLRERDPETGDFLLDSEGNYSLKSYANTSGTVLPTIGVMIEF